MFGANIFELEVNDPNLNSITDNNLRNDQYISEIMTIKNIIH